MLLLRDKLILQGEKRETLINQKLETQQCCSTSLGFLYPVFRRLNDGTETNSRLVHVSGFQLRICLFHISCTSIIILFLILKSF